MVARIQLKVRHEWLEEYRFHVGRRGLHQPRVISDIRAYVPERTQPELGKAGQGNRFRVGLPRPHRAECEAVGDQAATHFEADSKASIARRAHQALEQHPAQTASCGSRIAGESALE